MTRADYEDYLARFNARDYQGVLQFWAQDFEASFAGIVLRKGADLLKFYSFLHSYVDESISVHEFVADDHLVALRADVRIEGRRDLTKEILNSAGYGGIFPIAAGQVMVIPQLILYRMERGKFKKVYCAVL
jgi:SnoaL-like domain